MTDLKWNFGPVPHVSPGEKWVAELVDETNPEGPVCVRRANGDRSGAMTMPQDVYWAIRDAERDWGSGTPLEYRGVSMVSLPPTLAHLKEKS